METLALPSICQQLLDAARNASFPTSLTMTLVLDDGNKVNVTTNGYWFTPASSPNLKQQESGA